MSRCFSKDWFTARQLALAHGVNKKTIRRRARREGWPSRRRGNVVEYRAPAGFRVPRSAVSHFGFVDAGTLLALKRAAVVLGFALEMKRGPHSIEQALLVTVARFRTLGPLSVRALRRWVRMAECSGVAGLVDRRRGNSGARPGLHTMYKPYGG